MGRNLKLIEQIRRAYADVKLGRGVSWREGEEIDSHGDSEAQAAARGLDEHEDWTRVKAALFEQLPSAVGFLDAEGLRFYLPALMIADLVREGKWESAVIDTLLSKLDWAAQEILPLLTSDQREVVAAWMNIEEGRHPWFQKKQYETWLGMRPPCANEASEVED